MVVSIKGKSPVKAKKGTSRSLGAESALSLPKDVSVPSASLGDYALMIYGEKKIGKSSLCSKFPGALFFMFEPGGRSLKIRQIPQKGESSLTWRRFVKYITILEQDSTVKTVVIDTIDRAYEMCFQHMCDVMVIEHPHDENDYGKSWGKIKSEFEKQMFRLLHLTNKGIIFLSHAQIRDTETRRGETFQQIVPTARGQAMDFIRATVDFNAYYGWEGKHRVLTIQGNDFVWAGCGMEDQFRTINGDRVETIYMGRSPEQSFRLLVEAFANKCLTVDAKVPTKKKKKGGKKLMK